jgi:hypothetical protein
MKLNRKKLQTCLNSLSKVMARNKKATNVGYKNVQFFLKDNVLSLYALDGIHFISSLYGDMESADNTFMVEYDTLNNLISLSDTEEVEFKFDDTSLKIVSGKSKYKLQFSTTGDFKYFLDNAENEEQKLLITSTVENILAMITFISPIINNSVQERFKGIYFDGNFASTDGSGFALYPFVDEAEGKFFTSKESFSLISSIAKDATIDIFTTPSQIVVKSQFNTLILPTQVLEFPNYNTVITKIKKYVNYFTVNKIEFTKVLSRVKLFSDESIISHGLFKINKTQVSISANSSNKECEEVIPTTTINIVEDIEKDIEILIDLKRFVDYISTTPSEIIDIYFIDTQGKPSQIYIAGKKEENIKLPFYVETSLLKRNLSVVK